MPALLKPSNTPTTVSDSKHTGVTTIQSLFSEQGMDVFRLAGINMYFHASTLDAMDRLLRPTEKDIAMTLLKCFEDICRANPESFGDAYSLTIRCIPAIMLTPEQQEQIDKIINDAIGISKITDNSIHQLHKLWSLGYEGLSSIKNLIKRITMQKGIQGKILTARIGIFVILMNLQKKSHDARRAKDGLIL